MARRSTPRPFLKPTGRAALVVQLVSGHTMTLDIQNLALTKQLIGLCAAEQPMRIATYTAHQQRVARAVVRTPRRATTHPRAVPAKGPTKSRAKTRAKTRATAARPRKGSARTR